MSGDEIVREIRRIREEYAAKFNYDLEAIFQDIKEKEKNSGRKYFDLSKRKVGKNRKSKAIPT